MYSYGLLLREMRSAKKPFATHTETSVVSLLSGATREEIDFNWPAHFKTLLTNSWNFVSSTRPTIDKILETLQGPEFNIAVARRAPVEGFTKMGPTPEFGKLTEEKATLEKDKESLKTGNERLEREKEYYKTEFQSQKQDLKKYEDKLKAKDKELGEAKEKIAEQAELIVELQAYIAAMKEYKTTAICVPLEGEHGSLEGMKCLTIGSSNELLDEDQIIDECARQD